SSFERRLRATRRTGGFARQCIGRLTMSQDITPSRPPCNSRITQKWSWNGYSQNARWNRDALDNRNYRRVLVLFIALDPVARVLVQECQRLERPHPIEEQDPVQMIGFVLNDARRKIRGANFNLLAVPVEGAHFDFPKPGHAAADVGDAQAAFPVFDELVGDRSDLGI